MQQLPRREKCGTKIRRVLLPSSKALLAEFLLDLRLHVLPDEQLDAVGNIGRAKYDIRGIAELLKVVSAPPAFPPPPAPPPMPELQHAVCCDDLEARIGISTYLNHGARKILELDVLVPCSDQVDEVWGIF